MKLAPLIIAFGILAVLGALVWYTEENPPETGEQKPEIISVDEDPSRPIRSISVTYTIEYE